MSDQKRRHWTSCWLAGIVGFFLVAGSRNRRASTSESRSESVSDTAQHDDLDNFRTISGLDSTVRPSNSDASRSQSMPPESVDNPQSSSNPIKEISVRQWTVAAIVLVAIPIVAYFGAFYLYPYAQDLLEGESPVAAVLAEYGVDERGRDPTPDHQKRRSSQLRSRQRNSRIRQPRTSLFRHHRNHRHHRIRSRRFRIRG